MERILVLCSKGTIRSKFLSDYLCEKSFTSEYAGIKPDALNPVSSAQLLRADVIILIRKYMIELLNALVDTEDKKVIALEVPFDAKSYGIDAEKIAGADHAAFLSSYVYPNMINQIAEHLSTLQAQTE